MCERSAAAEPPTVENGWNGATSPVQARRTKVARTRDGCSAECRAEQKGAYSPQPPSFSSRGLPRSLRLTGRFAPRSPTRPPFGRPRFARCGSPRSKNMDEKGRSLGARGDSLRSSADVLRSLAHTGTTRLARGCCRNGTAPVPGTGSTSIRASVASAVHPPRATAGSEGRTFSPRFCDEWVPSERSE